MTPFNLWQSALVGVGFGAANLWLLSRIVAGLTNAESVRKWKIAVYFVVKMALIFLIIGLLLKNSYVTPLPFLGGFTFSLVAGILAKMFLRSEKNHVPL